MLTLRPLGVMATRMHIAQQTLDEDAALRALLEGTATEIGERFFEVLVHNLARVLQTHGAWVTEYLPEVQRLRALAFWMGGHWVRGYEHDIQDTPCQRVIEDARLVLYPDNVLEIYPNEPDLKAAQAVSYMGVPLLDVDGTVLGHLAVLDRKPMPEEPRALALFRIFAARAGAELRRLRAEAQVRESEEKLQRLVGSAMDAIIELDSELTVTRANPAAEKVFGCPQQDLCGAPFARFLSAEHRRKLAALIDELQARPEGEQYLWVPGGVRISSADGRSFAAETTLSRFELRQNPFYTLILRDVNERLAAEQRIADLQHQTEYLKEELSALRDGDEIIGRSRPLLRMLEDMKQVAQTDATVLVMGETGTGKERVARAIHAAGPRREKPLVTVNCAAIPVSLIESEFFGHERGAFTGATAKRDGRFALADGGTIFLDEIGELPIDLQSKLLRVLQEGEFEPVGSNRTRRVDVRVIAATNRDLHQAVVRGEFREDLYYRLNVFPIRVPPLRERGDDVALLAQCFADRVARKLGRTLDPISDDMRARLRSYDWPGNVRELQNVIERAVITSHDGRLDLSRAFPEGFAAAAAPQGAAAGEDSGRVHTLSEIREIERNNLVRALQRTGWRISGDQGAAQLLGMPASTLTSRMKALGIKRSH